MAKVKATKTKKKKKKVVRFLDATLPVLKLKDYGVCVHKDECSKSKTDKCNIKTCKEYESIQPYIPKIEEYFSIDMAAAETIAFAIANNENILLVGPPGCGKTTLVQVICAITQREVVEFSAHEETRYSHLIGQWTAVGNKMVFIDGYVIDAMRNGKVLLENESDFMRPELRGALHSVLDNNGTVTLQSYHPKTGEPFLEVIHRHKNFRWISTANTTGLGDDQFKFHGVQLQNAAARDRYSVIVKLDYRNEEEEADILVNRTGIDREIALKMSRVAWGVRNLVRSGKGDVSFEFTTRRLLAWANYYQRKENKREALDLAILNFASSDPTEVNTILNAVRTQFGADGLNYDSDVGVGDNNDDGTEI